MNLQFIILLIASAAVCNKVFVNRLYTWPSWKTAHYDYLAQLKSRAEVGDSNTHWTDVIVTRFKTQLMT